MASKRKRISLGDSLEPYYPGDLVRICPNARAAYESAGSADGQCIMWSDVGLNGGEEGSEFIRVPWDALGVVVGQDEDGPNGAVLLRVMFPQGLAAWWPDHFESVQ